MQRSRRPGIDGAVPGTLRPVMCLHPASPLPVPDDTAKVARRAFPRGNLLLSLRDKLGPIFDDSRFASLFPSKGQSAEAPWRLALVTLLQFAEDLSDRQAADAALNRLECVHETLRHALEVLALAAPEWLLSQVLPHWAEAYEARAFDDRLPRSAAKRDAWVQQIGEDGHHLLAALAAPGTPDWLRHLPATEMLRRVWVQQFYLADGQVRWRTERDGIPPAAQFISSPYDADARLACKGNTSWIGYKVHLSETCDEGLPRIITEVQTTAGPVADGAVEKPIPPGTADKGL